MDAIRWHLNSCCASLKSEFLKSKCLNEPKAAVHECVNTTDWMLIPLSTGAEVTPLPTRWPNSSWFTGSPSPPPRDKPGGPTCTYKHNSTLYWSMCAANTRETPVDMQLQAFVTGERRKVLLSSAIWNWKLWGFVYTLADFTKKCNGATLWSLIRKWPPRVQAN